VTPGHDFGLFDLLQLSDLQDQNRTTNFEVPGSQPKKSDNTAVNYVHRQQYSSKRPNPIAKMMDNFRGGAIAMLMPATTRLGRFQSFADTHLVALACAVMFASAVALPSFSSSALGLKGLYKMYYSSFS